MPLVFVFHALLYTAGIPIPAICHKYGVTPSAIYRWARITRKGGWDPVSNPIIIAEYLEDAPRSGRPTVQAWERTQKLIREVTGSKEGRNLSLQSLGAKIGVSARTAYRMLQKEGFIHYKESTKPGLTEEMMKARLEFCKEHEHWTLEDWKRVIWTDETSIILGHRRGKYQIWRRSWEAYNKTYVRSR